MAEPDHPGLQAAAGGVGKLAEQALLEACAGEALSRRLHPRRGQIVEPRVLGQTDDVADTLTSLDSVTLARRSKKRPTTWERPARSAPTFISLASPKTAPPNQCGVKLACTSSARKRSMSVSATENR